MQFYPDMLERELHPMILTQIVVDAMMEIMNYLQRKEDDFTNVQEFTRIIGKYFPRDSEYFAAFDNLYSPIVQALKKDSAKEFKTTDDLILEIKLLQYSLCDVPHLPREQREELLNFMGKLAEQFQVHQYEWHYGRKLFA